MRVVVFALLLASFVGCDEKEKQGSNVVRVNYQPEIRYQIVEVEGKRWIATPGSHGEWSLAGPLE